MSNSRHTTHPASHPAIRFEQLPPAVGPLTRFNDIRADVLKCVVDQTSKEVGAGSIEQALEEVLYLERVRLKRDRPNIFTQTRANRDKAMLGKLQGGLLKSTAEADRTQLMRLVLSHYAEEIGGRFNPKVYEFATNAVPWGFSWLLNAASVRRFLPWGMTQSLASRLKIQGEIPVLQDLAKKGTILLVPTHQSNIDSVMIGYIIYLMGLPPFAYGAGLNLFSNPALSFFMSRLGSYTVDRRKSNGLYKQILKNYSTEILTRGVHSIFFPGGGRTRSGAVESHVKLGLLGTGLAAQVRNIRAGKPNPNVFVVPMVTSYHFVLEASSLIDDFLVESGKHRFMRTDDESFQPAKIINFFWKLFSTKNEVVVRIGKPLDVFGNFVDSDGRSLGPNGTVIDPTKWLTTRGEVREDFQRDREYTRELGERLVERFHRENIVLTSHWVAFTFFEVLRQKYPDHDLFRFLRLSQAQRALPYENFLQLARPFFDKVKQAADAGEFHLSDEMRTLTMEECVKDGIRYLGILHEHSVLKMRDGAIFTEDMSLLYYYRNRMAGYGLSLLAKTGIGNQTRGQIDAKGFLA